MLPTSDATPEVMRLRGELRRAKAELGSARNVLAALDERLADLQVANEAAYARDYDRTGGPAFDSQQPVGELPARTPDTESAAIARELANLRLIRKAAPGPLVGPEWTALAELDRLEALSAQQAATIRTLRGEYGDLAHALGLNETQENSR
ncbi:hypothetical protein [Streptomyces sp. CAU 1734]|uniref:hypothetical protein n=1 Tax=Streptomyces sp. CAU 1734 TaxID=3140360 RepID=UPI00326102E8